MLRSCHSWALLCLVLCGSGAPAYAQTINVTGQVYDVESGSALIGATVQVQGTAMAATTDINGNFSLSGVQPDANLQVSIVGYNTSTTPVDGRTSISIPLYPSGFDFSNFYSRQSGDWNDGYTWSYVSHTGPPAYATPGSTGCNVIIGAGHTVTMSSNIDISSCGMTIEPGATFDMAGFDIHLGGDFNINGTLLNGGALLATFCQLQIYSNATSIPVFTELIINNAGCTVTLGTDIVLTNGVTIFNGSFDDAGYTIYPCIPPDLTATNAVVTGKAGTSLTLGWTRGNGDGGVMVVARVSGDTQYKPQPATNYAANAAFGAGDATGPGNYVVYRGTGTSVTITNLLPNTYYEFGIYEFNASACYNVSSFLGAGDDSGCLDPGAPSPVNASYCTGDPPAAISVTDPGAGFGISWYTDATGESFPPGATASGARGEILTPAGPGTFYAAIYDVTSGCESATRTAVTLTEDPQATAMASAPALCSGTSATIALGGSASWSWTVSAGTGITGATAGSGTITTIDQTLTNTSSSQQQVVYTITPATGCPATPLTVAITVDPVPAVFDVGGGGSYCTGDGGVSITLGGSQSGIQYELLLNDEPTGTVMAGTGNALTFPGITAAGTYSVRGQTSANCTGLMQGSATVAVNSAPGGTGTISGGRLNVCTGYVETYSVSNITGSITGYNWTVPDGMNIIDQSDNTVTIEVTGGNGGALSVTAQNECGSGGTATLTLTMLPAPGVSLVLPQDPYAAEPLQFGFSSPVAILDQLWDFGDGNTATAADAVHIYTAGGNYDVSVAVTDDRGCMNTAAGLLAVRPPAALENKSIKNVVTADGDDKNAVLYIEDIHKFPGNEVFVLDRWGVEVFRAKAYANDWNFTKDGTYLPAGNYICIIKLNETEQVLSRTITVIKRR